jgi:hypothetical protein
MGIPLDSDWNWPTTSSITEGGVGVLNTQPKQAKGGVFSQADIPLIKRALEVYKDMLIKKNESELVPRAEFNQLANLMHRLNNRI